MAGLGYDGPMASRAATVSPARVSDKLVRQQLARVVSSKTFAQAERLKRFVTFIVDETSAGRGSDLKEYVIGVQVFGKESPPEELAATSTQFMDEFAAHDHRDHTWAFDDDAINFDVMTERFPDRETYAPDCDRCEDKYIYLRSQYSAHPAFLPYSENQSIRMGVLFNEEDASYREIHNDLSIRIPFII